MGTPGWDLYQYAQNNNAYVSKGNELRTVQRATPDLEGAGVKS